MDQNLQTHAVGDDAGERQAAKESRTTHESCCNLHCMSENLLRREVKTCCCLHQSGALATLLFLYIKIYKFMKKI